jgi:hypothetical protein
MSELYSRNSFTPAHGFAGTRPQADAGGFRMRLVGVIFPCEGFRMRLAGVNNVHRFVSQSKNFIQHWMNTISGITFNTLHQSVLSL